MFEHQIFNSVGEDIYNAYVYKNFVFPTHLHKGYEFVCVLDGELSCSVGGKRYRAKKDECLLIPPFLPHNYDPETNCTSFIVVFSGSYVESFARATTGKRAADISYVPAKETLAYAMKTLLWDVVEKRDLVLPVIPVGKPDIFTLKSALYALCADFCRQRQFEEVSQNENSLVFNCLTYIENNFTADISLSGMANALGYDYEYLSRLFNRALRVNFKTLVNQYRCERAQHLLSSTDDTVTEIALASGFQSIRSFNRVFKEITGNPPTDFRK